MHIEILKTLVYALLAGLTVSVSAPAQAQATAPPKLYNNAKQKLLDGKTLSSYTVGRPDAALYCEVAKHYDFVWFEMQHSTMSWADIEKMIAACPHSVATPMVRIADELESSIQHATDIGLLGIIMPTVDTVEKAQAAATRSIHRGRAVRRPGRSHLDGRGCGCHHEVSHHGEREHDGDRHDRNTDRRRQRV